MSIPERSRSPLKLVPPVTGDAELTDSALWAGVASGKDAVASVLYARLLPTILKSLYRALGHRPTDCDDLVQLSFERIVRTLIDGTYNGTTPLRAWASLLASRVGLDALRKRYRERALFSPEVEGVEAGPERALQARSELLLVRRALATMAPDRAEAVFMHDALGYELSEIALQCGISVAAAQSRLVRGRKQLLEWLNANGED